VNLTDPLRDQLLPDRGSVDLGQDLLDVAIRRLRDARQGLGRIIVPGLQALQVEHAQRTDARQRTAHPWVDDRVHGGRQDRHLELEAAERSVQLDVGRIERGLAGRERNIVEAVGGA
jgi:hypothetical protein